MDFVRKRAIETMQVNPLEPLKARIEDFSRRGGTSWVCTPGVKSRDCGQEDLIEGVIITGSSAMHERIKAGAATLVSKSGNARVARSTIRGMAPPTASAPPAVTEY